MAKTTGTKSQAPEKGEKPLKATQRVAKEAKAAPKKEVSTDDKVMTHLKTHGKEFVGTVISDKAHKTVTVEWERRRLVQKFERYEKRYSRVYAHNPLTINAKMGDLVRIKETRPLSKTKNFVVVEVLSKEATQ